MRVYQSVLDSIESFGAQLVAVSPQTPDNSLSMAEKNELRFDVLSDAGNAVARQYGLVFSLGPELRRLYKDLGNIDLASYNGDGSWELPVPATLVIRPDGTVALSFVDADYTRRLEPADIVSCLHSLAN